MHDCGKCKHCRDMRNFGGPGRLKKSCTLKKCKLPLKQHQRQRLTVCPQVQKYKEVALFTIVYVHAINHPVQNKQLQ